MERTSLHNDSLLYASLIAILLLISYWFTTRCFKIISGIEGMGLGRWGDGATPSSVRAMWRGDLGTGCPGTSLRAPRSPRVSPSVPPGAVVPGSGDSHSGARSRNQHHPSVSYSASRVTGGLPSGDASDSVLGLLVPPELFYSLQPLGATLMVIVSRAVQSPAHVFLHPPVQPLPAWGLRALLVMRPYWQCWQ